MTGLEGNDLFDAMVRVKEKDDVFPHRYHKYTTKYACGYIVILFGQAGVLCSTEVERVVSQHHYRLPDARE
jgi:hypothetical protein